MPNIGRSLRGRKSSQKRRGKRRRTPKKYPNKLVKEIAEKSEPSMNIINYFYAHRESRNVENIPLSGFQLSEHRKSISNAIEILEEKIAGKDMPRTASESNKAAWFKAIEVLKLLKGLERIPSANNLVALLAEKKGIKREELKPYVSCFLNFSNIFYVGTLADAHSVLMKDMLSEVNTVLISSSELKTGELAGLLAKRLSNRGIDFDEEKVSDLRLVRVAGNILNKINLVTGRRTSNREIAWKHAQAGKKKAVGYSPERSVQILGHLLDNGISKRSLVRESNDIPRKSFDDIVLKLLSKGLIEQKMVKGHGHISLTKKGRLAITAHNAGNTELFDRLMGRKTRKI